MALGPCAVLILGASGAGKSALALQLMALGLELVADDRVIVSRRDDTLWASVPDPIRGLIEARGVGLLQAQARAAPVPLRLAIDLDATEVERLPPMRHLPLLDLALPLLHKVESPAFPAAIAQYLRGGRSA